MDEKEDKGFVVRDRRKISLDEMDQGQQEGTSESGEGPRKEEEAQAKAQFDEAASAGRERGRVPLPEVTLSTFVFSLSSSALVHLGEIPDPDTQKVHVDLPMAKQIIDTLGMLQEKTRGNLDPDEDRLLKSVVYDLRLRYVQKSSGR